MSDKPQPFSFSFSAQVEAAAMALARSELTDLGRRTFYWIRDFSEAERAEFRAKAIIVLQAAGMSSNSTDTETTVDIHGVKPVPGMRVRHWGDDEPNRMFIGTIGECIVRIGETVIEHGLIFVYDDPPTNFEDHISVPLEAVGRFELIDPSVEARMVTIQTAKAFANAINALCRKHGVTLWTASDTTPMCISPMQPDDRLRYEAEQSEVGRSFVIKRILS